MASSTSKKNIKITNKKTLIKIEKARMTIKFQLIIYLKWW